MGGVELQGPKLPAVMSWPRSLGILFWIHRPTPISDGPHGPAGFHRCLTPVRLDEQRLHAERRRCNRMRPIDPVRCAVNLAKLHNSNLQPTAVSQRHARANDGAWQQDSPHWFASWLEAEVVVGRAEIPWFPTKWPGCVRHAGGDGLLCQTTPRVAFLRGNVRVFPFLGWDSDFDSPPNLWFIA